MMTIILMTIVMVIMMMTMTCDHHRWSWHLIAGGVDRRTDQHQRPLKLYQGRMHNRSIFRVEEELISLYRDVQCWD